MLQNCAFYFEMFEVILTKNREKIDLNFLIFIIFNLNLHSGLRLRLQYLTTLCIRLYYKLYLFFVFGLDLE